MASGQCNPKLATGGKRRQRSAMNLEDHLGDIIRKAREMSNVSAAVGRERRRNFRG